jgi:hypothetical protein
MENLSEIKEDIVNFWSFEDDSRRDAILEKIRQYTESKDESELVPEIRNTFEQTNFSGISVIYDALSKNPRKWGQFFMEEYERAFAAAESSDKPFDILNCLEEIGLAETGQCENVADIVRLLSGYLRSPNDALRHKSVWFLGDWVTRENSRYYSRIVAEITDRLQDSNWKVRYIAKLVLEDMHQLPNGYAMSFLDTIRGKYLNPFKM